MTTGERPIDDAFQALEEEKARERRASLVSIETEDAVIDIEAHIYCWSCGYPSDDIQEMTLENAMRHKVNAEICGVCLDSPWVLDSWLNPWLYNPDTRVILESLAYQTNKVLEEVKANRK